jgi:hypothetical protein
MLKHRLMSDDYQRIELITGTVPRRHWTTVNCTLFGPDTGDSRRT